MNPEQEVDHGTGEIVVREQTDAAVFTGIAAERATETEENILRAPIPVEFLDLLPSGECYLPQIHYRRILNDAFGPMGWALRPMSPVVVQDKLLCREFALVIRGRFVACAIGEANYDEKNPRMTYATACEALKSNALVRCCKDIGVAWRCWEKPFVEAFRREHGEQVRNDRTGKLEWRRRRR